ncbi:glycoside hydrolase family 2 TIM barrel-domain containing protein [Ideonella sp. YS5]|uniref:glycoside hydrolase family 2 protein n=1 Tax=Ideonella sp. YS5 TaxID=3453714 RepID=UPI003EEFDD87
MLQRPVMAWRAALAMLGLLLFAGAQASVRSVVPLEAGWRFQRADMAGAQAPAFDDGGWAAVTLPHTWNAVDGEAGGAYYRGPAWYRHTLELSTSPSAQRRFLEFDGAALAADVWVNGHHAGRHEGGYARFRFDVSGLLRPGRNTLAVRVDNSNLPSVAPLGGDFTVFGGLYRQVRLVETHRRHIDLLDDGGPGVEVAVEELARAAARLRVTVRVRNDGAETRAVAVRLILRDAQGRVVLRDEQAIDARAGGFNELSRHALTLPQPHLWQGVRDPYLYRLTAQVLEHGEVVDELEQPVGIRQVAIDPQRGFLLNGQPYPLHGVNYFHPGRPGRGLAVGDADIDLDMEILQQLGVTGLRLVHFQHPQRVYEAADRLGFVLWTEIPLNSAMQDSPAFRGNLSRQLRELMRQTGNHPSVAIWGLGNEVYQADAVSRGLLAELQLQARRDDPRRPTAYAHCCAADNDGLALQTDITGYNRYYGWYDHEFADVGPWADALHRQMPGRAVGLSEYGAGGSVLQQEDPPKRPVPKSGWHPEQYQALFHEAWWRQIRERPWLWGSFVWVGFDLASAGRDEGDRPGINDKGLVTYDRQVRKDAFFWYRAQWSREPVVYITSRRHTLRAAGPTAVKVYTNAARVTLEVNGKAVGSKEPSDRIAVWPQVALATGRNVLRVSTEGGLTDTVVWEASP